MAAAYPEAELVLEEAGDEVAVGVHLPPVPARVGDHNGGDALDDRLIVPRHVDAQQLVEVSNGVALVHAVLGAPVPHEMLGAGRHLLPGEPATMELQ